MDNHNCNKILYSDWLLAALISALYISPKLQHHIPSANPGHCLYLAELLVLQSMGKSTHPRKFGNHVTVHRPHARLSAPQGNQYNVQSHTLYLLCFTLYPESKECDAQKHTSNVEEFHLCLSTVYNLNRKCGLISAMFLTALVCHWLMFNKECKSYATFWQFNCPSRSCAFVIQGGSHSIYRCN